MFSCFQTLFAWMFLMPHSAAVVLPGISWSTVLCHAGTTPETSDLPATDFTIAAEPRVTRMPLTIQKDWNVACCPRRYARTPAWLEFAVAFSWSTTNWPRAFQLCMWYAGRRLADLPNRIQ